MDNTLLPHESVETNSNPNATIIWLHGLGADGHDFESIVPELKLPPSLGIRFIFPHAPIRPVTINGGMQMRAWYDIKNISIEREVDVRDFEHSHEQMMGFIQREVDRGIPSQRIILAGFSQGGAIAYHTGLRCPCPLGGIIALSTYIPIKGKLGADYREHSLKYPIFIAHGTEDTVVPFVLGEQSRSHLESMGYQVQFHSYPMPHSLCIEEVGDISAFLQGFLD